MWNLEESLEFIKNLEIELKKVNWCVGLTGSVLTKGTSSKDLDLILYPANNGNIDRSKLHETLINFGLTQQCDHSVVHSAWKKLGSSDSKHVEVWRDAEKKRIDIFILT